MRQFPLNHAITGFTSGAAFRSALNTPISNYFKSLALENGHVIDPNSDDDTKECLLIRQGLLLKCRDMIEDGMAKRRANAIKATLSKQLQGTPETTKEYDLINRSHCLIEQGRHPQIVACLKKAATMLSTDIAGEYVEYDVQCHWLGSVPELTVGIFDAVLTGQIVLMEKSLANAEEVFEPLDQTRLDGILVNLLQGYWKLAICFLYNLSPEWLDADSPLANVARKKFIEAITFSVTDKSVFDGFYGKQPSLRPNHRFPLRCPLIDVPEFDTGGTGLWMETPKKPVAAPPSFSEWTEGSFS